MEAATRSNRRVTESQLIEAEKGLIRLLHAKHFPREWIEAHVPEVMAQARTDFAVRLAAGREDDTVNLLVVIAYRHAMKVLRTANSRPGTTSIEQVFHLADESTPTPEDEVLDQDRQRRLVKALNHLPERERRLLALVYHRDLSVREAGRRLGWSKSSADRHHQAALERLHALVGDRKFLAPEIGAAAAVVAGHHSFPRAVATFCGGVWETAREAGTLTVGRLGSFAESGSAAAASGSGRGVTAVCGAAVVACMAAATGVVGPGIGAIVPSDHGGDRHSQAEEVRVREVSAPAGGEATGESRALGPSRETHKRAEPGPSVKAEPAQVAQPSQPSKQAKVKPTRAPLATPEQTAEEFGVESGKVGSSGSASNESPPQTSAPSGGESAPADARPAATAPPSGSSGSSKSSGGSKSGSEFGM